MRELNDREVERGMLCPDCEGRRLTLYRKPDPSNRVVALRPNTVRLLIAGVLLLILGVVVLTWGRSHWNNGMLGARAVGWGIVCLIGGGISLLAGGWNAIRDIR